jgi:hypothetical protein
MGSIEDVLHIALRDDYKHPFPEALDYLRKLQKTIEGITGRHDCHCPNCSKAQYFKNNIERKQEPKSTLQSRCGKQYVIEATWSPLNN